MEITQIGTALGAPRDAARTSADMRVAAEITCGIIPDSRLATLTAGLVAAVHHIKWNIAASLAGLILLILRWCNGARIP